MGIQTKSVGKDNHFDKMSKTSQPEPFYEDSYDVVGQARPNGSDGTYYYEPHNGEPEYYDPGKETPHPWVTNSSGYPERVATESKMQQFEFSKDGSLATEEEEDEKISGLRFYGGNLLSLLIGIGIGLTIIYVPSV